MFSSYYFSSCASAVGEHLQMEQQKTAFQNVTWKPVPVVNRYQIKSLQNKSTEEGLGELCVFPRALVWNGEAVYP